ncbi:TIGR02300 family protein [Acidisoma cladoniae]|jgi:uncharacterized protein (TIGR02300 family)|uniref:TIGR02300 family protein n=1 Tax=Acidisoma cladoniae TaxID=3040935 RepID=UPI00254E5C3D|nr:TIGR02300 family protein [Acidisoma sp. PAMC 29798]
MVSPELGTKRTCVSCGARFYDLGKSAPTCPKCGTEQPPEQPRLKRGGNPADDRRLKKAAPAARATEEADPEAVEVEDVAEDDDVLDESTDLDDDDDVIETEIEVEKDVDERDL